MMGRAADEKDAEADVSGNRSRAGGVQEAVDTVMTRQASKNEPADEDLVQQVTDGHQAAFTVIVQRHQDRIHNLVTRMVGSAEDARDLTQDVFIKAYQNLDRFRGSSSLYTWLFRIAVNTSLSHRRKRKRVHLSWPPRDDADDGRQPGWADPAAGDPSDPLMTAETEQIVQEALDTLDAEHRTVVVLRDIQHFDYREIAEILDVPPGTVKSRLHRARLMLRDRLRPILKT